MIRLQLPSEPAWIDLPHGVRVRCRPLDTDTHTVAAHVAHLEATRDLEAAQQRRACGMAEASDAKLLDSRCVRGRSYYLTAVGLGIACIIEWAGRAVEDPATDAPAELSDANIKALMRIPEIANAFLQQIEAPIVRLHAEGNACAPSPDGSSGEGASTVEPAAPAAAPVPTAA